MRPEQGDAAWIWDMLEHARRVQHVCAGLTLSEFLDGTEQRYAIERRLEILGEASKNVSDTLKKAHPEVPWAGISGLRNVIAHNYNNLDYERIWEVIQVRIPGLISLLEQLLPDVPPDPEPGP